MSIQFSKLQATLIVRALSLVAFSGICLFIFFIFQLLGSFFSSYSQILLPPIVALIFAMILRPLYTKLYNRLWKKHALALTALGLAIFIPPGFLIYVCGQMTVDQTIKLFNALPQFSSWVQRIATEKMPTVIEFMRQHGITRVLAQFDPASLTSGEALAQLFGSTASGIGSTAVGITSFLYDLFSRLLNWMVLPIYIALLLCMRPFSGNDVKQIMVFAPEKIRNNIAFLIDQFLSICVAFFRGQVLVAFIQGICFGIGFQLVGLPYGLVIGFALGILNIVPYLGNILGLGVTLPLALFSPAGGWWLLIKVLFVFCAVQSLDSFFITPKVMGNRTGLNSFVVIFSLFFWNAVIGGVAGMILAIPLSAFIAVFWRLLCREYFPALNRRNDTQPHHKRSRHRPRHPKPPAA